LIYIILVKYSFSAPTVRNHQPGLQGRG